jgi:hypothetical protein
MAGNRLKQGSHFKLSEDWLSVLIAFLIILLSVIGLLGPNGLKIVF